MEGTLARDAYAGDRDVFPAGSKIRLVVDHTEKRKGEHDDHWPGVVILFAPRHASCPVFRSATVALPGGDVPLQVSLISIMHPVEVQLSGKSKRAHAQMASLDPTGKGTAEATAAASSPEQSTGKRRAPGDTVVLEAMAPDQFPNSQPPEASAARTSGSPVTLAAGTQAHIVLLAPLSASKSRPGDVFHARLIEPVRSGSSIILPAGSLFDGKVARSKPLVG